MEEKEIEQLIKQIEGNDFMLTSINLSGMNLTDEVLKRICTALSNNIHVVNLNLSNNHFSSEGLQYLCEYALKCTSLLSLNLSDCDFPGERLRWIANAICTSKIETLILDSTNISMQNVNQLSPLMNATCISQISLKNNHIGDDGLGTLLSYLCNMPTLRKLYLNNNGITEKSSDAINDFMKLLPNLETVSVVDNSSNMDSPQDKEMTIEEDEEEENDMNCEQPILSSFEIEIYCIMASLMNQLQQWKHQESLPPFHYSPQFHPESITLISSQTQLADEFHKIRNQLIDFKSGMMSFGHSDMLLVNEAAIQILVTNLPILIQALTLPAYFVLNDNTIHYSLENTMQNTTGTIHRCGKLRIEIILLLATLINHGYSSVIEYMIENHIISMIFEMMKEYPWNSILHSAVGVFLSECIDSTSQELVHATLIDCNLYCMIKRVIMNELLARKHGQLASTGCIGTLFDVLREIETRSKQNMDIQHDMDIMDAQQNYSDEEVSVFEEMKLLHKPEEMPTCDSEYYDFSAI